MEGEQQPVVIVDESRINFVLHIVRLAGYLSAEICSLYWLTVFVFSFKRDFVGLGLPDPNARDIHAWEGCVPRIADGFNLPERIKAVGLRNLIDGSFGSLFD